MDIKIVRSIVRGGTRLGIDVREIVDYSGRGMMGSTTAAVVCRSVGDFAAAVGWACALSAVEGDHPLLAATLITPALRQIRIDDLGRDIVIY